MRLFCALLVVLFLLVPTRADAAVAMYQIGNSLTWDSQPAKLAGLASQKGVTWTAGHHIRCSKSLDYIVANPNDTCITPAAPFGQYDNALVNYTWDAVTLQTFTGSTLKQETDAAVSLINLTRTNLNNANTDFYIYAAWPRMLEGESYSDNWTGTVADQDATPSDQQREFFEHLMTRVRAQTTANVYMIPIGEVLYEIDQKMRNGDVTGYTDIRQWYRDNLHMSLGFGRFVAASTVLATILGQSTTGIIATDGYDSETYTPQLYSLIETTVWDVVTSSAYTGVVPEPMTAMIVFAGMVGLVARRRRAT